MPHHDSSTLAAGPGGADSLRVLVVIKQLQLGGAEQLVVEQLRARSDDVEATVAYLVAADRPLVAALEETGAEVVGLGSGRLADPRWVRDLARLVRARRFDVVHGHSPAVSAAVRPLLRALRDSGGRPVLVYTEHNVWPLHNRVTRTANRLTAGLEDRIFAVSEEVRSSMAPRAAARTEVLVHGIAALDPPPPEDRIAARAELGVSGPVVCTVANLRPKKDHANLLQAAAKVLQARDDVVFLVVGDGPERLAIEALHSQLGLGRSVRLLGERPDARRIIAAADLFVLPSRYEGLPVVLMEAMMLGVPVVATRAGGVSQVVDDGRTGALVPVGDPDSLAERILGALADPAATQAWAAAGKAEARERFDVRRATAVVERAYRVFPSAR